jgi:threonine dehydrogenase-like Zn-dependent dehydrogenase
MRQLTFIKPGNFEWHDVPAPVLSSPTDAIVRPITVARCDLDLYIATGVISYPGPFAFGHEMVAVVVEAGEQTPFTPGDTVIVPFQIACGRCTKCRRGFTNSCEAVPFGAAFGLKPTSGTEFGGALSDLVRVPFADMMLVPLPKGVDPIVAASVSDNISDGWRAVAPQLEALPGASVLVLGGLAQSVGLYAAGAAVALGAGRVVYLDDDEGRRAVAASMGAETAPMALGEGRQPSDQFDIVVEAAGDAAALGFGVQSTGANGILTSVAIHLGVTTPVPLTRAYYKGLTFQTGRVNSRPTFPMALDCIACGRFHPEKVTHRVARFCDAPEAMADPGPKVIFTAD